MKKILAIIFALTISLVAFAMVACQKPDDDQPVYTAIDVETFSSAIEAYGDASSYVGVQGYKFDLDIDFETELFVGEELAVSNDIVELSGLLNYADLSDVELSLDASVTQKVTYGEETKEEEMGAKLYLYGEGLFVDTVMDLGEEEFVEKLCIREFTNDFESIVEMLMPLENNPPFIAGSDTEMTEEELTAAVMAMLDEIIYSNTGMTLEEFLASDEVGSATAVMEYLSEKLTITYCASLGHYVLEINVSEEVELRHEGSAIELPGFNLKVGLFAKENRITKFTVDFNVPVEDEPFLQVSLSFGETTDKIVKPTSIEDYVEVSGEDGNSLLTELKVGYESFMAIVEMISASRDNTLEFYASSQYEVIGNDDSTVTLTFTADNTILVSDGVDNELFDIQFMYSAIILAASDDGTTYMFMYTEATEEEPAYFVIMDLTTQEIVGIAVAVEADTAA
ncbi:MAG: hypothetical protein IKC48_04790 [Clostridia bacterium]|nr:hypothetical protein [Clostridia bacterium]